MKRVAGVVLFCGIALVGQADQANETNVLGFWRTMGAANWTSSTNWQWKKSPASLPSPEYPAATNVVALVVTGTAVVSTVDIELGALLLHGGAVAVTNGRAFTVHWGVNSSPAHKTVPGTLLLDDGVFNTPFPMPTTIYALTAWCGRHGEGNLDLGGCWDADPESATNQLSLNAVQVNLLSGGLRVDAPTVSMANHCLIANHAQGIAFRGDWTNPDATTTFCLGGNGTNAVVIGGDLAFGGCTLRLELAANGVDLVTVGGEAVLTNAVIEVGAAAGVTTLPAAFDVLRVPASRAISTNGLTVIAAADNGVSCSVSVDANRLGHDYLVLTPTTFAPAVSITSPAPWRVYQSGCSVSVCALATDSDGSVSRVEFYANASKIGEVTSAPYSVTWTNVLGGRYALKAVATDDDGGRGVSPIVSIGIEGVNAVGKHVFTAGDTVITADPACLPQ